jgi:hypothetical protein
VGEPDTVEAEPIAQPVVPPNPPVDGPNAISKGNAADTQSASDFTLSDDDTALLGFYFGADVRTLILKLHDRALKSPQAKPASFVSVTSEPITDRQLRTKLHQVIALHWALKEFANLDLLGYASHFQFAT